MGDLFSNLALGFSVALTLQNLGLAFLGCLVGTLVGVLPGVGPIATIAMLLPITFGLDPVGALIMLAGIYYGAQYGGSTTAILVNIPGEATSVVTTLDGHQMARQGRAGVALGIAAIGSFFAGTVATLVIAALGAPLTRLALVFGPAEYFSLMVMGLVFAVVLARGSILKAVAMILLGILLSTVGTDLETGAGAHDLRPAISCPTASISPCSPWACSASPRSCATSSTPRPGTSSSRRSAGSCPERKTSGSRSARSCAARRSARSSASCPATAPCSGRSPPTRSRRSSPRIRAVSGAAPSRASPVRRAANNAGAQTSFIPLLTLGIPPNAVMALMVGAMTIHGIVPGPQVMTKNPDLFWGMIASMWVGNLMLLIINLPLVGRLGAPSEGALPPDVPGHPDVLLHRHLLDQFAADRRHVHRLLRPRRLCR